MTCPVYYFFAETCQTLLHCVVSKLCDFRKYFSPHKTAVYHAAEDVWSDAVDRCTRIVERSLQQYNAVTDVRTHEAKCWFVCVLEG